MQSESLNQKRLKRWCQDGIHRVPDATEAAPFIERVGICTVYPTSTEVPNLFHAYLSNPAEKPAPQWDSPGGEVYVWRWALGKSQAAFYAALVKGKPTYVKWSLLPGVLSVFMERRTADELFDQGLLSKDAYRLAQAFEGEETVLKTGDLRKRAGFPTGKENRKAYLKAVEELERKLLIAKAFEPGSEEDDMSHAFVPYHYRQAAEQALTTNPLDGLKTVVRECLLASIFIRPDVWAKDLKVDPKLFAQAISELESEGFLIRGEAEGKPIVAVTNQGENNA